MLCDVCKCNDATVFLTQILEGKMQKVNLCDACSKEKGVQDPTGFALADLLLGIGAAEEIEKGSTTQKCPVCGFTQADFKKTGRLGCSACYHSFSEGLTTLLKAMHKGTEHVGKLPQRAHQQMEMNDRMRALAADLQKAVAEENYETAASLRDQIRKLEHEIAGKMKLVNLTATAGEWLRGEGPHYQIVISSRVRLARNLRHRSFPGWAKKAERTAILELIRPRIEELPEMQDSFSELLQDLSATEKQVLVERHLISREHAAKSVGSAIVMNRRQTLSIMINEEDHLRMQSIRSGLQLKNAFKLVDKVDSTLEGKLDFAFDPKLGYLTACPTNVGTGMRASAMLHLPGLVLSELINQVIQAVNKIGLAVRGLYGEGTEAMGNLFQISNQTTLGEKEDEIIGRLTKVIETIIEKEHDARQVLIQKKSNTLWDQIGRAYGVLTYAHAMTSKEALNLLSIMKLGVDLGAFPEDRRLPVDELFIDTQPAHLQKSSQQKMNAEERDHLRARIIRERLKVFPKPDISKVARESENGSTAEPKNNE